MGCDIHGVLQAQYKNRKDKKWHTIEEIEDGRNYRLFAALAGVRNGQGFAGIPTHNPIKPISLPKGFPEEMRIRDGEYLVRGKKMCCGEENEIWMGDHSHSYLTLDEIKQWENWDMKLKETGVLERAVYENWDKTTIPESWSGGVMGRDIILVEDPLEDENYTHIRCTWEIRTVRDACEIFWKWLDYMEAKHGWRGDLRIVFGFDN